MMYVREYLEKVIEVAELLGICDKNLSLKTDRRWYICIMIIYLVCRNVYG